MLSYIRNLSLAQTINILFFLFPISFIIGSLIVTINLYSFLILSYIYIKRKNYKFNLDYTNIILIFFFLLIIISSYINIESIKYDFFVRSVLLFRFALLYLIIEVLLINRILNLKKFFIVSLLCTFFVSIDIIIQYMMGYNLFGQTEVGGKLSGVFGSEAIAGGYIQKFALMSFFGFLFLCDKKKYKKVGLFILIFLILMGAFFASNKMPLILLFSSLILLSLIDKKNRYIIISSTILFISTSMLLLSSEKNFFHGDEKLKDRYKYAYEKFFLVSHGEKKDSEIAELKKNEEKTKDKSIKKNNSKFGETGKLNLQALNHTRIYITAIKSWEKNPLIGRGYKSFRIKCHEILDETRYKRKFGLRCATHPHNYHLEILHDFGLIGFLIISFFILIKLFFIIKKYLSVNKNKIYSMYFYPIILTALVEVWPLKSTGSLFTTWNGSAVWLIIALSVICKKNITAENLELPSNNTSAFVLSFVIVLILSLVVKSLNII